MRFMYTKDNAQKILIDPIKHLGADHLQILTAHASPVMASWLLKTYEEMGISKISVELILGMTVDDGISQPMHDGFKALNDSRYSQRPYSFQCSYLCTKPCCRENIFIWLKEEYPVCAYTGTIEFTQSSFLQENTGQLSECNRDLATEKFDEVSARSVYCNYQDIEDCVNIMPSDDIERRSQNKVD